MTSPIPWDDTLLAHHASLSHLPQRLDQVVSEYLDSGPWKIKYGRRGQEEKGAAPIELSPEEMCAYNAVDCIVTLKAWEAMQGDLNKERAIYEHDKKLALLCQKMSIEGIAVDLEYKDKLSADLTARAAHFYTEMESIVGRPFSPRKPEDIRDILFSHFGVRAKVFTDTGLPSTNTATLESLRGDTEVGRFAEKLLTYRVVDKIRSTYVGGRANEPLKFDRAFLCADGRARFNWKPFGTVSGRLSGRFQSVPRYVFPEKGGMPEDFVRAMYIPGPGRVFVYFDISQAEMRAAAFLSADPVFMRACEGDIHAANAGILFPKALQAGWLEGAELKKGKGKPFRDIAKNYGFAVSYYADYAATYAYLFSHGFGDQCTPAGVRLSLERLHHAYRVYFDYIERNHRAVKEVGYMRSPLLGRLRWFGWHPKITDVANYPVQSCVADLMNRRMIELDGLIGDDIHLVSQIHDACIYDCPIEKADYLEKLIAEQWAQPVPLAGGDLVFPIDLKRGMRWSEL